MADFREQLEHLINWNSKESGSNTPDFLLAEYLTACLAAFDNAVTARDKWYGARRAPGIASQAEQQVDGALMYDEHGPAAPGDSPMSDEDRRQWARETRDGM